MPQDLTPLSGLYLDASQIPVSVIAINLPSIVICATTNDTSIFINLATKATRTTPATGFTEFAPLAGLKIPTLAGMTTIQIEVANGDDFWGGVNAAGGYAGGLVTIWQGQVDTANQADPDQFTFSGIVQFYGGQLVNIYRAYDVAQLKVDPHPNANTIHLPRERYSQTEFTRCPLPGSKIVSGFTETVI